jgi:polyisoprenoid-binding protein YceI
VRTLKGGRFGGWLRWAVALAMALVAARASLPVGAAQPAAAESAAYEPEERLVDIERSAVTVRVTSEGLLGGFSSPIAISAALTEGSVQESVPHMQVVFDARRLRVLDSGLSAADRARVEARMLGPDVLDVARYPRISYHSITIERRPADWLIRGELEMHGTILPVMATATREGDRYRGTASVRQSDFGIVPVSRWAGLARVRDEVQIEFDVAIGPRP